MTTQPDALRLADDLAGAVSIYPQTNEDEPANYVDPLDQLMDDAAAELRRLHEENTQLRTQYDGLLAASVARIAALEQALGMAVKAMDMTGGNLCESLHHSRKHQHEIGESCPAVDFYEEALATARQTIGGKHD